MDRLRLLMLALVLLVCFANLVVVLWGGEPARDPPLAAASIGGMVAWALLRYRRSELWMIADLVPLGAVVVLGLTAATPEGAFGPTFVLLCFRAQFGGWTAALASGVAYVIAFLAPYAVLQGDEAVEPLDLLLLVFTFVVVAGIMHGLTVTARDQERLLRRERLLSEASAALLTARREDDLLNQAVGAISQLDPEVVGVEFLRPDGSARDGNSWSGARLLASGDGVAGLKLDDLPDPGSRGLDAGQPVYLERDAYRRSGLAARGRDPSGVRGLLIPLRVKDRLEGIVAIAIDGSEPLAELASAVDRFVHEVCLALGHRRLTEELLRADAIKDRFLSMLSHELRAPLAVVGGVFETLLARAGSMPQSTTNELVEVGRRQVQRQQRLIDDVLLTVRTSGHELPVRPKRIDVPPVVVQLLDEHALHDSATVRVSPGEQVAYVDELHLTQILTNLLTNASKYGAPPFEVAITRQDDQVAVEVRDHGSGIPEHLASRLFEPFEQATASHSTAGGVGLGLSIARQLARANGGELELRSVQGQGACFCVQLPAASDEPGGEGPGA